MEATGSARGGEVVTQQRPVRVFFVEDDNDFREALTGELGDSGFDIQGFTDGESLLDAVQPQMEADVFLLDWWLPGVSGLDVLHGLRQRCVSLPVVFLTGRSSILHESLAFESGAVDFVDKASGIDILVRRLRRAVAMTKPMAATRRDDARFVRDRLILDRTTSRARWSNVDVGLTFGEYNTVCLLTSNAGCPVTYRAIYDRMHYVGFAAGSGEDGFRMNVRSAIKRIRQKFLKIDPGFAEIQNLPAVGYVWAGPQAEAQASLR